MGFHLALLLERNIIRINHRMIRLEVSKKAYLGVFWEAKNVRQIQFLIVTEWQRSHSCHRLGLAWASVCFTLQFPRWEGASTKDIDQKFIVITDYIMKSIYWMLPVFWLLKRYNVGKDLKKALLGLHKVVNLKSAFSILKTLILK